MQEPTYPGVRVRARVVGVFWIMTGHGREAKLVCVPHGDPAYRDVSDLTQLPEHQLRRSPTSSTSNMTSILGRKSGATAVTVPPLQFSCWTAPGDLDR